MKKNSYVNLLFLLLIAFPLFVNAQCNVGTLNQIKTAPTACTSYSFPIGSGEYEFVPLQQGVSYQFNLTSSAGVFPWGTFFGTGVCINGSLNGNTVNYTAPSNGNYQIGTSRLVQFGYYWNGVSATMNYQPITPATPGAISGTNTLCEGATATYSISAVTYAQNYLWQISTDGGANYSTVTASGGTSVSITWPSVVTSGAFVRVRAQNGPCSSPGFAVYNVNLLPNPTAPTTAPKAPNVTEVCKNELVGLSGPATGGTNQGCTIEYRYSTDGGSNWSSPSTTIPTGLSSAVSGVNIIQIQARRNNCNVNCLTTTSWNTVATWTVDITSPVANAQNITAYLNSSGSYTLLPSLIDNNSTDNCAIATRTVTPSTFSCANIGPNTVTLTVTDNVGNTSSTTATVTILDTVAPTVAVQNIFLPLNSSGTGTITPAMINNGSTDACGIASYSLNNTSFDCSDVGANTVLLTVTDIHGNSATAPASVIVQDLINPVLNLQDVTLYLNSTGAANLTPAMVDNGSTDNCSVTLFTIPSSFNCNNVGQNTVLVLGSDPGNNVVFSSVNVTIIDTIKPTITAPANVTVTANASCTATGVTLGTPLTADNCAVATVTNNAPATFPIGTTVVTWTVTDVNGNVQTATQTVTVEDNTNPVISGPSIFTASAVANCELPNASSGFGIVVSDNCGVASLTNNGPANFVLGYNSITWTVTDNSGNTSTLNQVINVIDDVDPVITPSAGLIVNADANCQATGVTLTPPTITDNCTVDTFFNNAPLVYPIGVTSVTWTAIDASGNFSTATQLVTVVDNTAPVITCPSGSPFARNNSAGVCGYIVNGNEFNPVVSDNCGATTISHNFVGAPSSTTLAGATLPVGSTTIVWTVTDAGGLTSTCSITVNVTDNEVPVIQNCPSGLTLSLGQYSCGTTPNWNIPTATDNCGSATIVQTSGPSPTALLAVGSYTVVYTATDAVGNTSNCSFTINVVNTTAPVVVCPNNVVESTNTTDCFWTSDIQVNPIQASGNCPTVTWSITNPDLTSSTGTGNAQGYNFSFGTSTITYTITDNAAATATCSSTITVVDDIDPVVSSPSALTLNANASCQASSTILVAPANSDNCGIASVTNNAPANFPIGNTTVVWTVTDVHGNSTTVNQLVTVVDVSAPVLSCASSFTLNNAAGECSYTELGTALNISANDNCTLASLTHNFTSAPSSTSLAGATFPVGTTNVTWTATDVAGNTSTCVVPITVLDLEAPEFANCPANISIGTYTGCSGTSWVAPTATDNCSVPTVTQTSGPVSGTSLAVGSYTVTYQAIDASGNTATCSFSITVTNSNAPVVVCPDSISTTPTIPTGCDWISTSGSLTPILAAGDCPNVLTYNVENPNGSIVNGNGNASGFTFANGTSTLTYTITDAGGDTATCSTVIQVIENVDPFIIAPANITVDANASCVATGVNLGTPVTSDNCAVAQTTNDAPAIFPIGTTIVTWTVTDASGNTSNTTQTVTVVDNTNPVISAPADITVSTNTNCSATGVSLGVPTTSDNCSVAGVVNDAPATFPFGTTTVTWTVTDAAGNSSTAIQLVTVVDNTNPTITAPADVTVNANTACASFNVNLGVPVAADNCSVAIVTNNAPSVFSLGTTTVTWTVIDASGNTATTTQLVTVLDNTAPSIVAPADLTVNANASCQAVIANLGNAIYSDNCGTVTVTNNAPATYPLGTTIVTWTATDASGNTATATQTIVVVDNTAPTITAPVNVTVSANASCQATGVTLGTPVTADNCSVANVTNNAPATFPIGTTTVTWTVTDASGNSTTAVQIVTVVDNTNPTITAPANVTVNANSACAAFNVNLGTPITADNCTVATVTNNGSAVFTLGTTTVTWTVTDAAGNTATATQTVTVVDNTAPTVVAPSNVTVFANASCQATGVALGNAVASDNCTTVTVTNNALAAFPIGNTTVTWTATDAAGNSSTATQIITVIDNQVPTITAPANLVVNANGSCVATAVALGTPTTADNCIVATVTNNAPATYVLGTTAVTWTVTDAAGNTATATQLVTVVDNTNPTITAPANITVSTNSGCTAVNVVIGGALTSDNCTVASVVNNAPIVFPLGVTTVTWTVTDAAGNTATATQTVTVVDLTLPTIVAPANLTVPVTSACQATIANLGNPIVNDNCSVASTVNNAPVTFPVGTTTVTWTVTDGAGNTATAAQLITVVDQVAPVISAPATVTVSANTGCSATGVVLGNATATDDCAVQSVTNNAPAVFPVGTTTVTWTATDAAGNSASATQTVVVLDNTNPTITAPANVTVNANAACEAGGIALGVPTTADNCTVVSVTNNAPTLFSLGNTTVTWTVTDAAGNTSTATQTVTVVDNINPLILAPVDVLAYVSTSCEVTGVDLGTPFTSDNCSVASVTNDGPASYPIGETIVTWTVTDAAGNTSTTIQKVNVLDTVAPVVLTNNITVTLSPSGSVSIIPSDVDAGSTDNCSIALLTLSQSSFTCSDLGENTILLNVEDIYGNLGTAAFTVTVLASGVDADFDGIDDACDDAVNTTTVVVPNGFTPDGDGINDKFVIPGLSSSTSKALYVFNRYGNKVYESTDYMNDWDGTSSITGVELPDDTYYYVLELDGGEVMQGYVYINRVK